MSHKFEEFQKGEGYTADIQNRMELWLPAIAQFVEHGIGNIDVASSSPTLGSGRNGPPIHPVAKWVPDIWTRLASWLFNQHLYLAVV